MEVLAFVARRLQSDPIVLLAAVRESYPSLLAEAGLPQHRLGALPPAEAVTLLDASAPQLRPALRDRVLSEAAGNPLALMELPVTAARREPAGSGVLPLTQRLEQAVAARVSDLPEATRLLLLVAAHSDDERLGDIVDAASAVAGTTLGPELLEPAAEAAIVDVAWLAWSLTHAAGAVAVVTVAANAPTFLVTLIGASYADRHDRRRLMIGTDLARAALVGVAAILLASGLLHFALLVAVAAVLAAIGAPFAPARDALVARIAPPGALVTANALLQVSFRAAFFVGPLLLAPLLALAPMPVVLTLDALTFAVSAITLTAINLPPVSPARPRPGMREDLGAGLAVLRGEPDVLLVIADRKSVV